LKVFIIVILSHFKPGQIIDFRAMINEATKLSAEEGNHDASVSIFFTYFEPINLVFKLIE
jgi:hypothetical protein